MKIAKYVRTYASRGSDTPYSTWQYWSTDVCDIVFGHYCRQFQLFAEHTEFTIEEPCPHCRETYPPLLLLSAYLGIELASPFG